MGISRTPRSSCGIWALATSCARLQEKVLDAVEVTRKTIQYHLILNIAFNYGGAG